MDRQGKVNRWDDWEFGATYDEFKNGKIIGQVRCIQALRAAGFVLLEKNGRREMREIWRNRFKKVKEQP